MANNREAKTGTIVRCAGLVIIQHPKRTIMDIYSLILDDHAEQRKFFGMIEEIGDTDRYAVAALWVRLRALLDTHAEAEERYFYPTIVQRGKGAGDAKDMEDEVEDAMKDHNEIRDATAAVLKEAVGETAWFEAVEKANLVNSKHMAEEERQGMTDYRRCTSMEERHIAGIAFASYDAKFISGVKATDKVPENYVNDNKSRS